MELSVADIRMRQLTLPSARLERLYTGALWAEGPVYFPAGDYLLWSDIPNERLMQWVPDLGTRVYSHRSNNANGNTRDREGRLITCEHLTRSLVRVEPDGSRTTLADRHEGRPLNSPNDVVVTSDGAIWFTDPSYGIMTDYEGRAAHSEQAGCFVFRIDPRTGALSVAVRDMKMPNGLAFSPDESVLYVADSSQSHDPLGYCHVLAFPHAADGTLGAPRVLAEVSEGVPDGMAVDHLGNLWVSSAAGVEVFDPAGTPLGILRVPETVSNLTFGGPKNNRLFITATSSLYAVYTAVRGAMTPWTAPTTATNGRD